MLFINNIENLHTWGKVFQSSDAFLPLIKYIFDKHKIKFMQIENCIPGSNAVFKVDNYIIKIFAPLQSEIGDEYDYITEQFGIKRANELGLATPKLIGYGEVEDKYTFRYLIMEYVDGKALSKVFKELSDKDKEYIGKQLRIFTDNMDIKCKKFNNHKLFNESAENRWKNFSNDFASQRKEYLEKKPIREEVYVHGDLNPDNIILSPSNKICVIDFADALIAPIDLEYAGLICDTFKFDKCLLKGFFGNYDKYELTDICIYGLLIHDFGFNIIRDNIGMVNEINSVEQLRQMIFNSLL